MIPSGIVRPRRTEKVLMSEKSNAKRDAWLPKLVSGSFESFCDKLDPSNLHSI